MNNFKKVLYLGNSMLFLKILNDNTFEFLLGEGLSMNPTIIPNSIVFIDKFFKNNAKKGDIIISRTIYDKEMIICKRIIYEEGDKFTNNGKDITVPKGFIWIEGDNKNQSFDSRHFGLVPKSLIWGRVWFQIYPDYKLY